MSDIKVKLVSQDTTLKSKATFLPTGYIKPSGTLEVAALGLVDVTPYEKVNIKSAMKMNLHCSTSEPTDTSKLWVKKDFEPSKVIINSDDPSFKQLSNLPKTLYRAATVLVDTKIYVFGGNSNGSYSQNIYVFDIETETFTTLSAKVPHTKTNHMMSALLGTKIYLMGGMTTNTIYVFDIETETFTLLNTVLPTDLFTAGCVVVGTKIYLIGGSKTYNGGTKNIYVFDTETETIETLSTQLPVNMFGVKGVLIGKKIYIVANDQYYIYVFDTETETIEKLPTKLQYPQNYTTLELVGTKLYKIGGEISMNGSKSITIYDLETNNVTFKKDVLPTSMEEFSSVLVDDKIYLLAIDSNSKANYIYYPNAELTENILRLQSDTSNIFKLFNNASFDVEMGVKNAYVGNSNNEAEQVKVSLHNGTNWVNIN